MAVDLMRAEIGVNNISYATSESTKISLERYSKTPPAHKVTNQDIKAYADKITSKNLPEYKGFRIWTPEKSLNSLKRKMNLGYGFEGATSKSAGIRKGLRKRSDLLKYKEAKAELLNEIKRT
jgi:hypothetical protein